MKLITENRRAFRDETCKVVEREQIKKSEENNYVRFNSFFKYGWERVYLKWYRLGHPSVPDFCPRPFAILKKVRCIKSRNFCGATSQGKVKYA